jgi:hypothetical protein
VCSEWKLRTSEVYHVRRGNVYQCHSECDLISDSYVLRQNIGAEYLDGNREHLMRLAQASDCIYVAGNARPAVRSLNGVYTSIKFRA